MRLLRLLLPVAALLVMMFGEGNETALNVAYVMFGATGVLFAIGFIKDLLRSKNHHD